MTEQSDIEGLKAQITKYEMDVQGIPAKFEALPKWDEKAAKTGGECDHSHYREEDEAVKVLPKMVMPEIGNYGARTFCQEHFEEAVEQEKRSVERSKEELETKIATIKGDIEFLQKLDKLTRTSQIKDLIGAMRALLKKAQSGSSWDKKYSFSENEAKRGQQLLRLLYKIKPKSSPFLERGVAINMNLFLAGTAQEHDYRSSEPQIALTALDQNEKYKSIARVGLTLGEAERLRNLLVDCIEHVRIQKMIQDIEKAGITIPDNQKPETNRYEEE